MHGVSGMIHGPSSTMLKLCSMPVEDSARRENSTAVQPGHCFDT